MRVVILTTDNREHRRRYDRASPDFSPPVQALLQGLNRQRDLEIHVISCTQQPMAAPAKLADNVWFHLLHVPKIGWLRTGYQGCIRAVRRKVREIQPHVVHGQGTEREAALGAVFSGFPNVITIHGNMRAIAKGARARPGSFLWCAAILEAVALSRAQGVLCNSAYTEALVAGRVRRTWRVPNPLREEFFDTPLRTKAASAKPVFLNIGAIVPHKRQIAVLEIAEELHSRGLAFELQFIGQVDPRDAYCARFLQRLQEGERAGWARHFSEKTLTELIAALDGAAALIHASSEESFGLVVAEALARNLKLFSTDAGGLLDITRGVDGAEVFPVRDSQSLTAAIERWMNGGALPPRRAAHEMEMRYHPDVIAKRHEEIYREIAGAPRVVE